MQRRVLQPPLSHNDWVSLFSNIQCLICYLVTHLLYLFSLKEGSDGQFPGQLMSACQFICQGLTLHASSASQEWEYSYTHCTNSITSHVTVLSQNNVGKVLSSPDLQYIGIVAELVPFKTTFLWFQTHIAAKRASLCTACEEMHLVIPVLIVFWTGWCLGKVSGV